MARWCSDVLCPARPQRPNKDVNRIIQHHLGHWCDPSISPDRLRCDSAEELVRLITPGLSGSTRLQMGVDS